jgi:hypothetical protein
MAGNQVPSSLNLVSGSKSREILEAPFERLDLLAKCLGVFVFCGHEPVFQSL